MNQPIGSTIHSNFGEETIQIKRGYILRLKDYTQQVRNTASDDFQNKMAVIALLGYLEALEFLVPVNGYETLPPQQKP